MSTTAASQVQVLCGRGIVKRFPGVLAVDHVDFEINAGEVHGLIGENGAGKTTLMHILGGAQQATEGEILLDGKSVRFDNTQEALRRGISIVYQELNLIPYLTVAENIFLGNEMVGPMGMIDSRSQRQRCTELLKPLDPSIDPRAPVNSLRVGQQQIVEIAKALNSDARVIFMDEPTSAISDSEVETLFRLIKSLQADGISTVYVSHKLDELLRITDRITILRDGKFIETVTTAETRQEDVVSLMVGRELSELYVRSEPTVGAEVLRVESVSQRSLLGNRLLVENVSFSVCEGEVLGVFGLMGAGRTELLESIFGLHPSTTSSTITVQGQRYTPNSPAAAMQRGIGLVPEDRKEQGLVLGMSVENNMSLSNIALIEKLKLLSSQLELKHAQTYIDRLAIKTPSAKQTVGNLSGGNQQKVVIGRVLSAAPSILLLDEPTRGIDVNAKREIYGLIDELKKQGMAIVVVSSELPELLGIADRMMVMCEGRKTAEFDRHEATEEKLMQAAVPGFYEEAAINE